MSPSRLGAKEPGRVASVCRAGMGDCRGDRKQTHCRLPLTVAGARQRVPVRWTQCRPRRRRCCLTCVWPGRSSLSRQTAAPLREVEGG
jgi:hypothetical protein